MWIFFFSLYGAHPDLHVRTLSVPTRRSSDLEDGGGVALRLVGDIKARDAVRIEQILNEPLHIPAVFGAVQLNLGIDLGIAFDLVDVAVEDIAIAVAGIGQVEARDERHVAAQMRRILHTGAELVVRRLRQLVDRKSTRLNSSH